MDVKALLKSYPLFEDLSTEQVDWIATHCGEVVYEPGETVFEEGVISEEFLVLVEGEIDFVRRSAEQERFVGRLDVPGTCAGEIPLLTNEPNSGTGRANQPTKVLRLSGESFHQMIIHCRPVLAKLLKIVAARFQDAASYAQNQEKMAALGKFSAGLAHDLNNPSAAAQRATQELTEVLDAARRSLRALARMPMTVHQVEGLHDLFEEAATAYASREHDPLGDSDREDEINDWLEGRDFADAWKLAPTFAQAGLTVERLGILADSLPAETHQNAFTWLERSLAANELVQDVNKAAQRISEIVQTIKSFSFMDQAQFQRVDVHKGLDDTLTILSYKLKEHHVEVIREYEPDMESIEANGPELNQVWTNLIDNAIDAIGPGGGTIRVRTLQEPHATTVEIADDGPGIPEDLKSKIFDPFFTTKEMGKGMGLGLQTVHRVVRETHKGDILVHSEPGDTRFRVHLPR